MSDELYGRVFSNISDRYPQLALHPSTSLSEVPGSIALTTIATFYDHVVISNTRFTAFRRGSSRANSLVVIRSRSAEGYWVGELQDIIVVKQQGVGTHRFGHVRWLNPVAHEKIPRLWASL